MSLLDLVEKANYHASRLAEVRQAEETASAWREFLSADNVTGIPIKSRGFRFHSEGAETLGLDAEEVNIPLVLPALEVEWHLRRANYRVEIQTGRPASLNVYVRGEIKVYRRRVIDTAVLDLNDADQVRITSTAPILSVRVTRFARRAEGELILGPFYGNGVLSARAVGFGTFEVNVASDTVFEGSFSGLSFTPTGNKWVGGSPSMGTSTTSPVVGQPWSLVRRFVDVDDPVWATDVRVGRNFKSAQEIKLESTTLMEPGAYWTGQGRWLVMTGINAPLMSREVVYYTYIWGTAQGYDRAWDMTTGRRGSADTPGWYLLASSDPDQVVINGLCFAHGEPLRSSSDPLAVPPFIYVTGLGQYYWLGPGDYTKVEYEEAPPGAIVRVRGRGQLRSLELSWQETHRAPGEFSILRNERIDLSSYVGDRDEDEASASRSSTGIYLPFSA